MIVCQTEKMINVFSRRFDSGANTWQLNVASHADVVRGSSRVPNPLVGQERVTNP